MYVENCSQVSNKIVLKDTLACWPLCKSVVDAELSALHLTVRENETKSLVYAVSLYVDTQVPKSGSL